MVKQKIMLDVGCGSNCQNGFVGMDKRKVKGVQIIHDVEEIPWPVESKSCAVILMSHLIEHIKPWKQFEVMDEAWRILELGGHLMIATPHGMSYGYLQDPTHCSPWVDATPSYFCPGTPLYQVYRPRPWKQIKMVWSQYANMEIVLQKISMKEGRKLNESYK